MLIPYSPQAPALRVPGRIDLIDYSMNLHNLAAVSVFAWSFVRALFMLLEYLSVGVTLL